MGADYDGGYGCYVSEFVWFVKNTEGSNQLVPNHLEQIFELFFAGDVKNKRD